ncbi:MAG: hypothetical protein Q9160_003931 [Pyrenula sp. 1 TL-2023]
MAELVSLLSTSYILLSNLTRLPFSRRTSSDHPLLHLPFSSPADLTYALRRFGHHPRPLVFLAGLLLDVRGMRKLESEILNSGNDESVMAFKSSHLDAVGGTQLTSAILAQLSMTTLQLDGLSDMHWSASGFMLSGILFGIVAVILATMQQQVFGMLNDPLRVKLWLSAGYYGDEEDGGGRGKRNEIGTGERRLKASVASLQIMRIPNTFLSFAALAFLVSIGLFLGFSARQDLDRTPGRDNNKAVLILWLVTAFVAVSESAGCGFWKVWEDRRLERESGIEDAEGFGTKKNRDGRGADEENGARGIGGPEDGHGNGEDEEEEEEADDDESAALLKNHPEDEGFDALAKALEKSAMAHARCADADREVARLMKKTR